MGRKSQEMLAVSDMGELMMKAATLQTDTVFTATLFLDQGLGAENSSLWLDSVHFILKLHQWIGRSHNKERILPRKSPTHPILARQVFRRDMKLMDGSPGRNGSAGICTDNGLEADLVRYIGIKILEMFRLMGWFEKIFSPGFSSHSPKISRGMLVWTDSREPLGLLGTFIEDDWGSLQKSMTKLGPVRVSQTCDNRFWDFDDITLCDASKTGIMYYRGGCTIAERKLSHWNFQCSSLDYTAPTILRDAREKLVGK
ncbi:unnamed protein product [Allacma fusca]|uniref:Uncharacterized protein n=1 Tax=Allacma fusca TaxID=39272 RepID=A0A8J2JI62_9HEXA|nr:unnamed protein product [Allacma fusca]